MESWRIYLWVGLGGGLGSVARFWASGAIARWLGETFPWGTFFVNVSGSFLIGLLFTATSPDGRLPWPPAARQFFMLGICGGYTTFSSFSLQTFRLMQERQWLLVGLNTAGSVVACIAATWLGHVTGALLNRGR